MFEFVCRPAWRLYKNLFILVWEIAVAILGAWNRGYSWLFRSDFPSCSKSAEMSTLCVLKNVPVFFFKNAETSGQNRIKFNPPPPPPPSPPSLSVSKHRRISIFEGQNTVHVSFTLLDGDWGEGVRGGRGEGWTFMNVFEALLPRLWKKKTTGTFFNTKRVDMPNFSRFGATWKYVRMHLNFASWPVLCEKMFLCWFFHPFTPSTPPPPPPPHRPPPETTIWIHDIWTPCADQQKTAKIIRGHRVERGVDVQAFVSHLFYLLVGKKTTQEHLFT